MKSSLLRG
jgi:hypothetical protein